MNIGETIFAGLMLILIFGWMKITDLQISKLDKRMTNLEARIDVVEVKLKINNK